MWSTCGAPTGHRKTTVLEPELQSPVLRGSVGQSVSSARQRGKSEWWGQGTSHWLSTDKDTRHRTATAGDS